MGRNRRLCSSLSSLVFTGIGPLCTYRPLRGPSRSKYSRPHFDFKGRCTAQIRRYEQGLSWDSSVGTPERDTMLKYWNTVPKFTNNMTIRCEKAVFRRYS